MRHDFGKGTTILDQPWHLPSAAATFSKAHGSHQLGCATSSESTSPQHRSPRKAWRNGAEALGEICSKAVRFWFRPGNSSQPADSPCAYPRAGIQAHHTIGPFLFQWNHCCAAIHPIMRIDTMRPQLWGVPTFWQRSCVSVHQTCPSLLRDLSVHQIWASHLRGLAQIGRTGSWPSMHTAVLPVQPSPLIHLRMRLGVNSHDCCRAILPFMHIECIMECSCC